MSDAPLTSLPDALLLEVDGTCDDFERFWRRARRRGEELPSPDAFLTRVAEAARPALRIALDELQRELLTTAEFPDIPGYQFLAEIARGPMGVVYRVLRDGRELALKSIQSAELALWSRSLQLLAEGELLTTLRHPHIVPVESFGEHEGLHYLVMPLVEGGDLRRRLGEFVLTTGGTERRGRITVLMAKVAGAVAFLHQHGILHRDLKPSNILLTPGYDCEPLVCDFGLARRINAADAVPQSREVVGTLAYMAPEQMEGQNILTEAADIWSLGAVLYELLTGSPPFTKDRQLDQQRKLADTEPASPASGELHDIARQCLQREPAKRYCSAAALADDLRYFAERELHAGDPQ